MSALARTAAMLVGLMLLSVMPASAQSWPTKPVKIIVSLAAGGTPDIICRLLSERLCALLGQPVVVENRPGGANVVGASAAAHAPADGYTLLFATAAALVSNPYTFKSAALRSGEGFRRGLDGGDQSVHDPGPSERAGENAARAGGLR